MFSSTEKHHSVLQRATTEKRSFSMSIVAGYNKTNVFFLLSPEFYSVTKGRTSIIEMIKAAHLFTSPVPVSWRGREAPNQRFALFSAVVDTDQCLQLLLQHEAKVNAQDLRKNTPAMVATFFNKPTILTTLIRAGADLLARNDEGAQSIYHSRFRYFVVFLGRDAHDIALDTHSHQCKNIIIEALEKRKSKANQQRPSTNDKLNEERHNWKTKR